MPASSKALTRRANQAAMAHMGAVAWPTALLGVGFLASYGLTLWATVSGYFSLWLAVPLTAFLTYLIYTILHEAVHGTIGGDKLKCRWLNESMGFAAGQILFASFIAHRKEHLAHHRHTNGPGKDPDLALAKGGVLPVLRGMLWAIPLQISYYRREHWPTASGGERLLVIGEYVVMIAWRAGFVAVAGWQTGLALLIGALLLGALGLITAFVWLVHRPFDAQGRYADTAIILFPKGLHAVVTAVWMAQNYHGIHHLFPRVPFYRYPALFAEIQDLLKAQGAPIIRIGVGQGYRLLPRITDPVR